MWPSILILAVILTLNFQGQILYSYVVLYAVEKYPNCHETKKDDLIYPRPKMGPPILTLAMTFTSATACIQPAVSGMAALQMLVH